MIYRRIVWKRLDEKTVKARQRHVEGTIYAPSMDFRLLMQDYRAGTMHDILPAGVLWGSFVTHSFLPDGGEMNAWGGGRIWPILLQLWSPSFCAPRLEYSSSRAYYLLYSFHFYHFLPRYVFHGIWTVKFDRLIEFFSGEERRLCVILVTLWQLTLLENEIFYPSQYLTGNKFSLTFCKFSLAFLQPCKQLFVILNQMSWHVVTFCVSLLVRVNLYEIWAYHLCDIEFYCFCSIYP